MVVAFIIILGPRWKRGARVPIPAKAVVAGAGRRCHGPLQPAPASSRYAADTRPENQVLEAGDNNNGRGEVGR
jgi:hypothetical protein